MQNCETKIKLKPTYSEEYTVAINRPTCCMGRWVKWSEVGGWDEEDFSLPPLFFFFFKPNIPGSGTCHRACSSHEQQCSPLRPHSHKAVREGTFTRIKWRPCLSWNAHTQSWLSFTHVDVFLFVFFLTWMKPYVYSQKMHWRLLSHNNQHWNSGLPAGSVDKLAIPGLFSEPNWAKFLHKCWPKPLSLMCWADEWLHPSYIMGPFSSINSAVKGIGGTGPEGWIPGHM